MRVVRLAWQRVNLSSIQNHQLPMDYHRAAGTERLKSLEDLFFMCMFMGQYSCLENPMDRGACGLQSMGSQRVRHD